VAGQGAFIKVHPIGTPRSSVSVSAKAADWVVRHSSRGGRVVGSVQFQVLGPLRVLRTGGEPVPLPGQRQRRTLATLLLTPNRTVGLRQLIDAVWDDRPPPTAKRQIQNCISGLRRELACPGAPEPAIVVDGAGYLIRLADGQLDAEVFRDLSVRGRAMAAAGNAEGAVDALRAALQLWRGNALEGLTGRALEAGASRLDEERLAVLAECVDLELGLGREQQLIGELTETVAGSPLSERLVGQLMTALYRSGRQADALRAYQALRERLSDELGIDPCTDVQQLHTAILRNEAVGGIERETAGTVFSVSGDDTWRRNQLPRDVGDFTGREHQMTELITCLAARRPGAAVAAISGKPGVGKTALAVHVGHRLCSEFPDGQLFINLGGMGGRPVPADEVLMRVLTLLGVGRTAIPRRIEARAEMYRAHLATRRLLIMLDDAVDEAQVRPLLPAGTGSAALITSRKTLAGLEVAHRLSLVELDRVESVELLERVAGPDRLASTPEAADRIVELCGRLPLAIRIAGAKLALKAHWSPWELVDRLTGEQRRLDELQVGDLAVRASFSLSYQALDLPTRQVFDTLGLLHTVDFPAWVPATMVGRPIVEVRDALERLVDAQLLDVARRDPAGRHRYRLHDLLAVFARERRRGNDVASGQVGLGRAVGGWLTVVDSMEARLVLGTKAADQGTGRVATAYPLGWLPSQLAALQSSSPDSPTAVWEAGWAATATLVAVSFELWSHWDDWRMTRDAALIAAHRVGDRLVAGSRPGEYRVLLGHPDPWSDVVAELEAGASIFEELGEWRWHAAMMVSLGNLYRAQGDYERGVSTLRHGARLFHHLAHPGWEAAALFSLGSLQVVIGRLADAVARYDACAAIFQRLGNRLWQAHTQRALGYAYQQHGRYADAAASLRRCLPVLREQDDPMWAAHTLLTLARAELEIGRCEDAVRHLDASLSTFRQRGDLRGQAMALRARATATGRQDPGAAIDLLGDSLRLFRQMEDPVGVAHTLHDIAEKHRALGRHEEASRHDRSCLALCHELGLKVRTCPTDPGGCAT
jgi:DNA-binding SARP family transcriptional activator